ncbi:hypothetical protein ACQEU2_24665 [Microtetraspora malaysiensis]
MGEVDLAAGELRVGERDLAAGELRVVGELRAAEPDVAAGELRAAEPDVAAGELRAAERDPTAGELRAAEPDVAARELRAGEVGAVVEDHPGEVQVESAPGDGGALTEVGGDETDDRGAHLAHRAPGPMCAGVVLGVGFGFGRHAQVGAQHVDAHLAAAAPIVGEGGQGVDAGQADRGGVGAEFVGGLVEAFGVQLGVLAGLPSFGEALFAVGDDQGADAGDHGEGDLDDPQQVGDLEVCREGGRASRAGGAGGAGGSGAEAGGGGAAYLPACRAGAVAAKKIGKLLRAIASG